MASHLRCERLSGCVISFSKHGILTDSQISKMNSSFSSIFNSKFLGNKVFINSLSTSPIRSLFGNKKNVECSNVFDFFSDKLSFVFKNSISSISPLSESEWASGSPWLEDEDVILLEKSISKYNDIQVLEVKRYSSHPFSGSRILILDRPGNIHSIYFPLKLWTDSYYDLFATIPFVVPNGPIAILGLGAGTAARILFHVCPDVEIHGCEIDPEVIRIARQYFDLSELEKDAGETTKDNFTSGKISQRGGGGQGKGIETISFREELNQNWFQKRERKEGNLIVHVGDALSKETWINAPAKFSAILVDMFAKGAVISQLQDPSFWKEIKERLLPGGRIMINCGGQCVEPEKDYGRDGETIMLETLVALHQVFGDELWIQEVKDDDDNVMALTGIEPDFDYWATKVPTFVRPSVHKWKRYSSRIDKEMQG